MVLSISGMWIRHVVIYMASLGLHYDKVVLDSYVCCKLVHV